MKQIQMNGALNPRQFKYKRKKKRKEKHRKKSFDPFSVSFDSFLKKRSHFQHYKTFS